MLGHSRCKGAGDAGQGAGSPRPDRPWSRPGRAAPMLVAVALAAACGDASSGPSTDGDGGRRDATVVDASLDRDATAGPEAGADGAVDLDGFVPVCPTESCDPRDDSGCVGKQCVLSSEGTSCLAHSADLRLEGFSCGEAGDCASGLVCFAEGDGGVCRAPCCGSGDSCGPTRQCVPVARFPDDSPSRWGRCMPARACDVLAAEGACEPDEACYIVSESGETDCRALGAADVGGPCVVQEDCAGGLFCPVSGTCVRICSLGDAGGPRCLADEGNCVAYSYTPRGTGVCTVIAAASRRR